MREQVLVVPRALLFPTGAFHGFSRAGLSAYLATIAEHAFFAARDRVEEDASLKQIIPYVILRHAHRITFSTLRCARQIKVSRLSH